MSWRILAFIPLVCTVAAWAADPVIGTVTIRPTFLPANTPTLVTVTAAIADTSLLANGANVQRLNAAGAATAVLGLLHDDGLNGDAVSGDRIFSARFTLTEANPGRIAFRASAAFPGIVQRVGSSSVALDVANGPSTLSIGATATAPPNAAGWNRQDVTITFQCSGGGGGLQSCPGIIRVGAEGKDQTFTGQALDGLGFPASTSLKVSLDKTPPSLVVTAPPNNSTVTTANLPIAGTVADDLAGVASVSCRGQVASLAGASFSCTVPLFLGSNPIAILATDIAGNVLTSTLTVTRAVPPSPQISVVNPSTGQQGQSNLLVALTGANTNFVQGQTQVSFGGGITVGSVTVASPLSLTANISIGAGAAVGLRTVSAITGAESVSKLDAFTVTAATPVPSLSTVIPATAQQGQQNLAVSITGVNTNFTQGQTQVSFGVGITVGSVTVVNKTSLTANLNIDVAAAIGLRNIGVTTGAEIVTLPNGFTVSAATPAPSISTVIPATGQQGQQNLSLAITGVNTNFTQGQSQVSFGAGITLGTVSVTGKTTLTALVTIAGNAAAGLRTASVTTGAEVATKVDAFTVTAAPAAPQLSSISPNSGIVGQSNLLVTIVGTNTNFTQGQSQVSLGSGITVGTVTVATKTSLTANLAIDNAAALGARTLSVTTGAETVTLASGFTVNGLTDTTGPNLTIASPSAGTTIFVNKPLIDLSYSDSSGVDTSSLRVSIGGSPISVDCQLSGSGGTCTPIVALVQGLTTLSVAIKDTLGNQTTRQVQFTIDSTPVEISITSPANNLITGLAQIEVRGTAGAGVNSVKVNGVATLLTGGSFTATVQLRDGVNTLVALATTATGKTGTNTVDVTRDVIAPIVRIDSPSDGLSMVSDKVTVTGLVNDIVNGGTQATVKVNGVAAMVVNGGFVLMNVALVNGPNTIEAVATDAVGNVGRHSISVNYQRSVSNTVVPISGDGQAVVVKLTLPQPLVAIVKDESGNPVAGRVVRFEVTRNSGTLRKTSSDPPTRVVEAPTDGSGKATVLFTVGDTAGQGNNRVKVTASGVAGVFEFCASGLTAPPQKILMTMGDNQRGTVSNPLPTPLEALVVDADGNPVANLDVTFRVAKGNGTLNGQTTRIVRTGDDGVVRAIFTLGSDAGINNNVVNATFPLITTLPATFTASGIAPGNPANTRFSGVVLDNAHTPIPNATITLRDTTISVRTDAQGQFLLTGVPVGTVHLRVDPSSTTRPEIYPPLEFEHVTIAGVVNNLGQPILIPALDAANSKVVGGNQDVILTMKGVPGLQLKIFANSVTFKDGTRTGRVSIDQVHLDKVPMAPPRGVVFMAPAWTVQAAGTKFNPPAQITIPNSGLAPGRVIELFQFDHDLNQFISIGKATVAADGMTITSDPGFGITAAGWGGGGPPQPPTTCTNSCNDGKDCTDDSVNSDCSCANSVKQPVGPACVVNRPVPLNNPTTADPGRAGTGNWGVTSPDFAKIDVTWNACLTGSTYKVQVTAENVPFIQDFNMTSAGGQDCDTLTPTRLNFCAILGRLQPGIGPGICKSRSCLQVHEDEHKIHRTEQWNALKVADTIEALSESSSDQICTIDGAKAQLESQVIAAINQARTQFRTIMASTKAASETRARAEETTCHTPNRVAICNAAAQRGSDGDTRSWKTTNPCAACP